MSSLLRSVVSWYASMAKAGKGIHRSRRDPFQVGLEDVAAPPWASQQHGPARSKKCLGIESGRRSSQEITRLMGLTVEYH